MNPNPVRKRLTNRLISKKRLTPEAKGLNAFSSVSLQRSLLHNIISSFHSKYIPEMNVRLFHDSRLSDAGDDTVFHNSHAVAKHHGTLAVCDDNIRQGDEIY